MRVEYVVGVFVSSVVLYCYLTDFFLGGQCVFYHERCQAVGGLFDIFIFPLSGWLDRVS